MTYMIPWDRTPLDAPSQRPCALINEVWVESEDRQAVSTAVKAAFADQTPSIDRDWRRMTRVGCAVLDRRLPERTRREILGERGAEPPIIVVRNGADVESIPRTPLSGFADDPSLAGADTFLLALCSILQIVPTAYPFENEGRFARNVVPHPGFDTAESSWGSRTGLSWHQDNNFQPFEFEIGSRSPALPMPRFLAFLALRNHELVPTQLLTTKSVVDHLPNATLTQLRRPAFLIDPPENARITSAAQGPPEPSAILSMGDNNVIFSRFDATAGLRGIDQRAERALEAMRKAVQAASTDVVEITMRPGDAMVFDNYRVMHRRPPFEPRGPGEGRWLRRIYGLTERHRET